MPCVERPSRSLQEERGYDDGQAAQKNLRSDLEDIKVDIARILTKGTCMKDLEAIAEEIESESERQCIERLGYTPGQWITGGSNHNDFRLTAEVDHGTIIVTDGNAIEEYTGDIGGVADFVWNWHYSQDENA